MLASIADGVAKLAKAQSGPLSPQVHLVKGAEQIQLLVVNGSRIYNLPPEMEQRFETLLYSRDEVGITQELIALGLDAPEYVTNEPLQNPTVHALSLAVAQKCNMGCSYCYAGQGSFGGAVKNMALETAFDSVDLLLRDCPEGGKVQLTFLGGEPLTNRTTIRLATEYASRKAAEKQIRVNYSITTNGTLLTAEDAEFFEEHGFSVTVSIDGFGDEHDRLRPLKNGKGTFETIMKNVEPLLTVQQRMQVSARVTVTPLNLNLSATLQELVAMGFHSVGFSPLLHASNGQNEMSGKELDQMLANMISCGLDFERKAITGVRYPFLNMINALKEIGKGTHRPYPCGAGAGYLGVSADGELAACHRFVNEPSGKMGSLSSGVDSQLQNAWLIGRHVHTQIPCNNCWARYMCGGGCHHEVLARGRNACTYIRGWLHYVLQAHERLSRYAPRWHASPTNHTSSIY